MLSQIVSCCLTLIVSSVVSPGTSTWISCSWISPTSAPWRRMTRTLPWPPWDRTFRASVAAACPGPPRRRCRQSCCYCYRRPCRCPSPSCVSSSSSSSPSCVSCPSSCSLRAAKRSEGISHDSHIYLHRKRPLTYPLSCFILMGLSSSFLLVSSSCFLMAMSGSSCSFLSWSTWWPTWEAKMDSGVQSG